MNQLFSVSELSELAKLIEQPYSSSWNEFSKVLSWGNFNILQLRQNCGSKVNCLLSIFQYGQQNYQNDGFVFQTIAAAFSPSLINTNPTFKRAIDGINSLFELRKLPIYYDYTQGYGLIDLRNPPEGYYGKRSNAALLKELEKRGIYHKVLTYCSDKSINGDEFSVLFEATKGLFEELRRKANLNSGIDGHMLIDQALLCSQPLVKLTKMKSEQDLKDQRAIALLFKAAYSIIRNPLAHRPVMLCEGKEDLFDLFTIISYLYRKLDNSK